jgi:toxin ParE1/3/4
VRVVWTETAASRLAEIEDYISRDNARRAATFVDELIDAAERLGEFPDIGLPPPERPNGPYEQFVHKGYRILFRRTQDTVYITSVFHGARRLRPSDLNS